VKPSVGAAPGEYPSALATTDRHWMSRALGLATQAAAVGEVPVGAVLVGDNELLAEAHNSPIGEHDPTAHAEILALREAARRVGNYRLPGTTLYVTLEPCPMCAGAMIHARVERVVFAAPDPRSGAAGSVFELLRSPCLNHQSRVSGGLLGEESAAILRGFFRHRRGKTRQIR